MKLQKQVRRERALARFRILSEQEWHDNNPNQGSYDYAEYVARKQRELASLQR